MLWFFLIFSTLSWGIAEIFYKKGNKAEEKYSHLKTTVFVGILMGLYSLVVLCVEDISIKSLPENFVRYLPVSLCYIVSMTCSYFGVRFIEESLSDPIENTSGALVPILCAIFLHEKLNAVTIIAVIIVAIGILCVGFFDKNGKENRVKNFGVRLAIWAIAMPFCYMLLDAIGTFLDVYYTDSVETTLLINVTEDNLEHTANCCYEFTFFIISMAVLVFMEIKKIRLFSVNGEAINEVVDENGEAKKIKWYQVPLKQKNKILAAAFETAGQATYLFALSEGAGIAAVILGAGTVITSLILSRIILKEKLSKIQYVFILIIMIGIIMLSLVTA